jgi:hypothetical protein
MTLRLGQVTLAIMVALGLATVQGCKKKKKEVVYSEASAGSGSESVSDNPEKGAKDKKPKGPPPMKSIRIPEAPISLKVPKAWKRKDPKDDPPAAPAAELPTRDGGVAARDGGAAAAPDAKPPSPDEGEEKPVEMDGLILKSAEVLRYVAPAGEDAQPPIRLQVFHDPNLPMGTTVTRYLKAQRKVSFQGLADVEHVEAERSRRDGRPAFFVRDTFSVKTGISKEGESDEVYVTQISLLLIEAIDGALHGYTVVATLLDRQYTEKESALRAIFDSVHFDKK